MKGMEHEVSGMLLYAKTEEEYNELIAKFKENMWIRVNGYVKNNPFYNDFVLNARNIEKIDSLMKGLNPGLRLTMTSRDSDIERANYLREEFTLANRKKI